jgi:hypothetical protein
MIIVDDTCISDDIADKYFVCNIEKCKGACCVEGHLGAPLEEEELTILSDIYDKVEPYLTEEGKKTIEKEGLYIEDYEGDYSTPTINGRECAYANYENGKLYCGIEKAYLEGKITYRKPISCHLYPIRITKYDQYDAINYDRWHICNDACSFGEKLGVPLYKFLKEPLIRKYGEVWYRQLVEEIEGI